MNENEGAAFLAGFSLFLGEDQIMREALQEIWEMNRVPAYVISLGRAETHEEMLARVFDIVDRAVETIAGLTPKRADLI